MDGLYQSATVTDIGHQAFDLEQSQYEQAEYYEVDLERARAQLEATSMQAKREAETKESIQGSASRETKQKTHAADVKVLESPIRGKPPQ